MKNPVSLETLCATLADTLGILPPASAAHPNEALTAYVKEAFGGEKADRIFMYNPDAIAQWVYEKYPHFFKELKGEHGVEIPFSVMMPSVTPVNFATMYTGASPRLHGIQAYVKPVLTIDTLFDAMIRQGKKPAIVSTRKDSMSMIFLEREMDYFIFPTEEEANAKAMELILQDQHDLICLYNGNYDATMHKFGPESAEALGELRSNVRTFGILSSLIQNHWKEHNTLLGFAMDHGCHEIDGDCGAHGLDMDEDINIVHTYKAFPKAQ